RDAALRVPAVDVVAREPGGIAEVLAAGEAGRTAPARPAEPRDADAVARGEPACALEHLRDDLVAQDERQPARRELPRRRHDGGGEREGGGADGAWADAEEGLAGPRCRVVHPRLRQGLAGAREHHRPHRRSMPDGPSIRVTLRPCGSCSTIAPSSRSSSTPRT